MGTGVPDPKTASFSTLPDWWFQAIGIPRSKKDGKYLENWKVKNNSNHESVQHCDLLPFNSCFHQAWRWVLVIGLQSMIASRMLQDRGRWLHNCTWRPAKKKEIELEPASIRSAGMDSAEPSVQAPQLEERVHFKALLAAIPFQG